MTEYRVIVYHEWWLFKVTMHGVCDLLSSNRDERSKVPNYLKFKGILKKNSEILKNSRCRDWNTLKKPVGCDFHSFQHAHGMNTCMMVFKISTVLEHFINNPAIFVRVLWSWKH